jgi:hypothetical protein
MLSVESSYNYAAELNDFKRIGALLPMRIK